jgi:hypothetical protein
VLDFTHVDHLTSEDVERLRQRYGPLTDSVRGLIDAVIRTQVDDDAVAAAKADIDAVTERLRSRQLDDPFGVLSTSSGEHMPWGNPVIGLRNPIAPPVVIRHDASGAVYTDFHLGAAYEDRPGTCTAGSPRWSSTACWGRRPRAA